MTFRSSVPGPAEETGVIRPNRIATLPPLVLAILLAVTCAHYQDPRGPEAEGLKAGPAGKTVCRR